jgi:hypothetical protein
VTDELNTPALDNEDDLIGEDPLPDRAPTDDEYAELLKRAVEKMLLWEEVEDTRERERQRNRIWDAFHNWVDDWVEEGVSTSTRFRPLCSLSSGATTNVGTAIEHQRCARKSSRRSSGSTYQSSPKRYKPMYSRA